MRGLGCICVGAYKVMGEYLLDIYKHFTRNNTQSPKINVYLMENRYHLRLS